MFHIYFEIGINSEYVNVTLYDTKEFCSESSYVITPKAVGNAFCNL